MTPLDALSQQAFTRGRQGFLALRNSHNLHAFAEVPTLKFAAGVGINCRPKPGQSRDGVPVAQECSWSDFAEGVKRYASTVVGPTQADKRFNSAYVLAGSLATGRQAVGHVMGVPGHDTANRDDSALSTVTMLVLDCDQPASPLALCAALNQLHLAYCVAPTWSATVERPKWRLFLQVAALPAVGTVRGRAEARLRYAWLAGLLAEMGGLPVECGVCKGLTPADSPSTHGPPQNKGEPAYKCKACRGSGLFTFDLSCWNYSRLHFLGGLRTADQSVIGRDVAWGKGFAVNSEAWLEGSGWGAFWSAAVEELGLNKPVRTLTESIANRFAELNSGIIDDEYHPDPLVAQAMAICKVGLLERVRRALAYLSSPTFPAAVVGQGGDSAVMRACSVVVSGFLVPTDFAGVNWARRVMDVAYQPRCSRGWKDDWIDRKLSQVRAVAGRELGALLSGGGPLQRERFYLSKVCTRCGGKGSTARGQCGLCKGEGSAVERAYSAKGELLGCVGEELELWIEAARSCGLVGFDPRIVPANWVARPLIGARV